MGKKRYIIRFYDDVNNEEDNFCISKFKFSNKEYDDFFNNRGSKLLLTGFRKGNNLLDMSKTFKGFLTIFLSRRYNKQKVKSTDHEIYISILCALHKLKKINIFKHILIFKIKSKSSNII